MACFCVTYISIFGVKGWFHLYDEADNLTPDSWYAESLFLRKHIVVPMLMYQVWNLCATIALNQVRSVTMIGHHTYTILLSYFSASGPYGHYYVPFYFGLIELSNLPLTAIEVMDYFPWIKEKHPFLKTLSEGFFVLSFFIFRIFMWVAVSHGFIIENIALLNNPEVLRSAGVVYFYLSGTVALSALQFFWAYQIIKVLSSPAKPDVKENKD